VTSDAEASRGRYFAWLASHPHASDDASAVWAAAWKAGAWHAIRANAQLGLNLTQIVQRLEELADLYTDRAIEREVEDGSAYWNDEQVDEGLPL
jgi:nicotinamide riboside transporter PnuC